ncbi:MAG: putative polysaccharide biosynthesis protein [uncultured bacterium (gcode 4)]|uniref:Putative polysaccharide biosynthesis protein n=1 Tax=uncultured bacterium (gcode 4) TaxID=1234023 RepID=K2F9G3_9BACT|nr:MAG: putative polysaccharide biosynthesis protein [uncultured bacterium (gcode 4)]
MKRFIEIYKGLSDWPKKVLHNMNWLFFEAVFKALVSFFVWTWLARYFWPSNFWIFNYAVAFVWIFSFIANLWLDSITIKELVEKNSESNEILWSVFFLKLFWSFFAIILINLLSYFLFYKDETQSLIIFIISLWFVFQTFNVINLYFQSKVDWKYNVIASWLGFGISNIFKIIIILSWLWIVYLSIAYLIDFLICSIAYIYIYFTRTSKSALNWRINWKIAKKMFIMWFPLALSSVAAYIYLRIDQIMIWNMMSSREVWLYSVSVIISESTLSFFWIIWPSLFPALISSKKISPEVYKKRLKLYYALFSLISLCLILPVYYLSDFIILFLFWSGYSESIIVLKIYIWSIIQMAITIPLYQHMTIEEVISYSFYSISAWAVMSVLMNYFLIPRFWLVWAAFSTTIPSLLSLLVFLFFKKTRNILIFWIKSFNPFILFKIAYSEYLFKKH